MIDLDKPVYDTDRQFVNFTIKDNKMLEVGKTYKIDLEYEGKLDNSLAGLYYSSYDEPLPDGSTEKR